MNEELIGPLLKEVSRSFYLTLRVLPKEIRPQISLAYLLARATDTIADTNAVPSAERVELLQQYRDCLTAPTSRRTPKFGVRQVADALPAEQALLDRLPDCLQLLASFSAGDQRRVGALLDTIIAGQIFDLERFPGELTALADDTELDRYTYLVAGCVGEFWTRMCAAHLRAWNPASTQELGIWFGKGLQLVNILRDIPRDLRIGRCYLPVSDPRRLLAAENFTEIQPLYNRWLNTAVTYLEAGWQYTMAIPLRHWRLRLACTWPIWIGLETITLLRRANPLEADKRVMVPQSVVNRMLLRSVMTCWCAKSLDNRSRQLVERASAPFGPLE